MLIGVCVIGMWSTRLLSVSLDLFSDFTSEVGVVLTEFMLWKH